MAPDSRDLLLLYDGLCGFCDRTVRFVLARDRRGTMRFAPLQGEFAAGILARHPELRDVDSLILVERAGAGAPERITVRSDAVVRIADYVCGGWSAAALLRLLPRAVRDWGYDVFARSRYRIFGRYTSCPIPDPGTRARFID